MTSQHNEKIIHKDWNLFGNTYNSVEFEKCGELWKREMNSKEVRQLKMRQPKNVYVNELVICGEESSACRGAMQKKRNVWNARARK